MKRIPGLYISLIILFTLALAACGAKPTQTSPPITAQPVHTATARVAIPTSTITPISTSTATPQPTETPLPTADYFAQAYPLGENTYIIPLTVRHVSDQQATFFCELSKPAEGKLVYRNLDTQVQEEIALSANETRQMISLDGLTPNTPYEALVLLDSPEEGYVQPGFAGEAWGAIRFHTSGNKWPVRVGVVGDASFGDEATQRLVSLMARQSLDFVIDLGDVVYEADSTDIFNSYIYKYFKPFAPLLHQGPVYTVLGNHDYDNTVQWQGAPFYDYAFPPFPDPNFSYPEKRRGNQYYAFAYQGIQFLMLDTHVFAGADGRDEQDAWLEQRLADPRVQFSIPAFHTAPYSSSIVHRNDGLPIRYSWDWRFEDAQVPLVLSGHFHHYERLIANGVTYIVSGGGSSVTYAQGELLPESQIYLRQTHFVLLELYPDHIDLKAIGLGGEVIDQAEVGVGF